MVRINASRGTRKTSLDCINPMLSRFIVVCRCKNKTPLPVCSDDMLYSSGSQIARLLFPEISLTDNVTIALSGPITWNAQKFTLAARPSIHWPDKHNRQQWIHQECRGPHI